MAVVVICDWTKVATWHYVAARGQHSTTNWSRPYKTKEGAISAAVKAGFGKVRCEGRVVVHRTPDLPTADEPVVVMPVGRTDYDEESDRQGVRELGDDDLRAIYAIRDSLHSPAIGDEILKEMARRGLSFDVKGPVTGS